MPHFAHTLIDSDPDALANLREVLHGAHPAPAEMPNLAERFGTVQGGSEAVKAMRKAMRKRRRQTTAAAPTGSLVTP